VRVLHWDGELCCSWRAEPSVCGMLMNNDRRMRPHIACPAHVLFASTELQYPGTLSNKDRRFIHKLAGELGLFSKSYGSKYVRA